MSARNRCAGETVADFGSARSRARQALLRFTDEDVRSGLVHGLFVEHIWRRDGHGAVCLALRHRIAALGYSKIRL